MSAENRSYSLARATPLAGGPDRITGAILAGGAGRRLGGQDKGLVELAGEPMVRHVIRRLAPQVERIVVNANRNQSAYAPMVAAVVADQLGGYQGPLAGMHAVLASSATPWVVFCPCDTPLVRDDLVAGLWAAMERAGAEAATIDDGTRLHPVFALLPARLAPSLAHALSVGDRRVEDWMRAQAPAYWRLAPSDPMLENVNNEADRTRVAARLRGHPV